MNAAAVLFVIVALAVGAVIGWLQRRDAKARARLAF